MTLTASDKKVIMSSQIVIPAAMVCSLLLTIAYFSWVVSTERAAIHGRIDSVTQSVSSLAQSVNKLTTSVNINKSRYLSEQDIKILCLQHQILNPNWRCIYGPAITNRKGDMHKINLHPTQTKSYYDRVSSKGK